MRILCQRLGLEFSPTTLYPSWNGQRLEQVYPWGTIRTPTPEANLATMRELTDDERREVRSLAIVMVRQLGYDDL